MVIKLLKKELKHSKNNELFSVTKGFRLVNNLSMKKINLFILTFLLVSLSPLFAQEAKVVRLKGQAFVDGKAVKENDLIPQGKEVQVKGKGSFIQVKLSDGSLMLQKTGTLKFKILEKEKTLISLLKGQIFVFKNPKEKSKLNVKTKRVSMAVRGTKFFVEETDETYLCVCEGKVAARNKKGSVDVGAGEDLHAKTLQSLEKTSAKKMMMDMASSGFDLMGVPVKK